MQQQEIKYEDALAELESIAQKMEAGEYDIDELTVKLKRAQMLIKMCREKLEKTDSDIKQILGSKPE
jgi:exodeoxyribonuclease VII small subunit